MTDRWLTWRVSFVLSFPASDELWRQNKRKSHCGVKSTSHLQHIRRHYVKIKPPVLTLAFLNTVTPARRICRNELLNGQSLYKVNLWHQELHLHKQSRHTSSHHRVYHSVQLLHWLRLFIDPSYGKLTCYSSRKQQAKAKNQIYLKKQHKYILCCM